MRLLSLFIIASAFVFLTGCNTFDRRAQQKAEVFASLAPETRERLKTKSILVGDTTDMVFIALGKPHEISSSTTAERDTTTWTYNRYWQEYQGEAYAGMQPRVMTDPKTGASRVYYEPIRRPVYASRQQPVLRITFADGKVSVVERAQN